MYSHVYSHVHLGYLACCPAGACRAVLSGLFVGVDLNRSLKEFNEGWGAGVERLSKRAICSNRYRVAYFPQWPHKLALGGS